MEFAFFGLLGLFAAVFCLGLKLIWYVRVDCHYAYGCFGLGVCGGSFVVLVGLLFVWVLLLFGFWF